MKQKAFVIILSGKVNSYKTSTIEKFILHLKNNKYIGFINFNNNYFNEFKNINIKSLSDFFLNPSNFFHFQKKITLNPHNFTNNFIENNKFNENDNFRENNNFKKTDNFRKINSFKENDNFKEAVNLIDNDNFIGGFITKKIFKSSKQIGYNILDLRTFVEKPLAYHYKYIPDLILNIKNNINNKNNIKNKVNFNGKDNISNKNNFNNKDSFNNKDYIIYAISKYRFLKQGFEFAENIINYEIAINTRNIFIDEAGFLEIFHFGFYPLIIKLLAREINLFIVVRDFLVQTFIKEFNLKNYKIINIK